MPETISGSALRELASTSLFAASDVYIERYTGELQYDGERPAPCWRAHGYFSRTLRVLGPRGLEHRRLWKRRWLNPETGRTRHSRPPDEMGALCACSLVFTLVLFGWLQAPCGLARHQAVLPELEGAVSRRTMQRWLAWTRPHALQIQHHCRLAVIQRSEPRPVEKLFRGGLSPPQSIRRRFRTDPQTVTSLWRGLALILTGAIGLKVPAAILLAEARGRSATPNNTQWI